MWDWSGIFDRKNLEANGWDGADGRFTAWAWALDLDVNLTEALVEGALSSGASGELSGEWGGFLSTLVAESASGLPSDDVTSSIGDGVDLPFFAVAIVYLLPYLVASFLFAMVFLLPLRVRALVLVR